MPPLARFLRRPRHAAMALFAVVVVVAPTLLHAASPGVDSLINKLPDPDRLAKSPLETAIASQDPMFKDPEFLRFASSAKHNDPKAALQSLRVLTAKYPDKPALQFMRGAFALATRQTSEAETCFRTVTAVKTPAAALGWYGLAGVYASQRRVAETVAALQQSVKLQPKFTLAWMQLANINAKQGHAAEGIDAARHVTQLQPGFAPGWATLAFCESNRKQYDDAIADYRRATVLAHNYAFAYEGMGVCYAVTNRPADAVNPLKTALALVPRDYLAATELGYCYLRSGRYDDAVKACHQAVSSKPGYAKAWDVMGLSYRQQGKKHEALESFRHAVDAAPNDPTFRAHFAEAGQVGKRT